MDAQFLSLERASREFVIGRRDYNWWICEILTDAGYRDAELKAGFRPRCSLAEVRKCYFGQAQFVTVTPEKR
jgi:hypothetical protein